MFRNRKTNTSNAPWPRRALRWIRRTVLRITILIVALIALFSVVPTPRTLYMYQQSRLHGPIDRNWHPISAVNKNVMLSVVAAEDANFCRHWGFDTNAIRAALRSGANRGASTITQQVVKNQFLWHGRSWVRKALEAMLTPLVELFWSKRRILEVYLNIAEFDRAVFGIEAAAFHYFRTDPENLTLDQAARLAAILPNPVDRNAADLNARNLARVAQIKDGARTIAKDDRSACFLD